MGIIYEVNRISDHMKTETSGQQAAVRNNDTNHYFSEINQSIY
jgi:hypothetical protein